MSAFRRTANRLALGATLSTLALLATPLLAQQAPNLSAAEISVSGDASEVLVSFEEDLDAATHSHFKDGNKVVVEITGVSMQSLAPVSGSGLVQGVSFEAFGADGVKAIIALNTQASQVDVFVEMVGGDVAVRLTPIASDSVDPLLASSSSDSSLDDDLNRGQAPGAVSGPIDAQSNALRSLDYEHTDTMARVVIGTAPGMDYTTSQPEPNLLVVDFPSARLPSSLGRVLDTSQFISPVQMVRAYSPRAGMVRVAISLNTSSADWTVSNGPDNLVYLDVAIPAEMQQDRALAMQSGLSVSPATPGQTGDQGVTGYSTSETLIGESGQTANPSQVWGSGGGSSAPGAFQGTSNGFMFDSTSASASMYNGRRINLDLVEADIHSVFRLIHHVSGLNIVAGDDVQGTVTMTLEDVPWDQAFAAILQSKSLGAQRFGNIVRVAPIEVIKAEQQAALEAQKAREDLTPLKVLVVPLNYAQAGEVTGQVESMLSTRGSVEIDSRSNQLIVKETEDRLAQIRELIRHIDRQTPQVLIEARIVEATSSYTQGLGVQWGGELDASGMTGYGTGLFFPNNIGISGGSVQQNTGQNTALFYSPDQDNLAVDLASDSEAGSLALSLGSIPGLIDIDARLSAMEAEGWGEIISAPRVTTLDNVEATIRQGARVPFLSTSAGGTQVQFIEAALVLTVRPHITSDGKIFMDIDVSNNRPDFSQAVQGQPAIVIKEAQTQLLVADSDTMVIGGVFASEESFSTTRIPFFGRIPVLGVLFRNKNTSTARQEMLVFVTPSIVRRSE
ncbi:MAG: type IV pilus secretin PilQ [Myxococcota bacterium]|nr:type IV pilus secretin PilQ [Myxococcota bacterium]